MDLHDRVREFWDRDAHTYDDASSHAVSDPVEAAAWRRVLIDTLPPAPASVLDVGAGTGSLSLLAAELGYEVTAFDISAGMLEMARRKAEGRGLEISFVVGSAAEPPPGPFDAVMERHLLWTTFDPVATLAAWREVVPGGRLAVFEGVWGRRGPWHSGRDRVAEILRRVYGVGHDHHAPYPEEVLAQLPLARLPSPRPLVDAVHASGWRAMRIKRLRDVEWAQRLQVPPLLAALEAVPRYALIADA